MSHHELSADQLSHLKKLVIEWSGTPHEDRIEDLENLSAEFKKSIETAASKQKDLEKHSAELEAKVAEAVKEARRALELAGEAPESDPRLDELEELVESLQEELSEARCASREFAGSLSELLDEFAADDDGEDAESAGEAEAK